MSIATSEVTTQLAAWLETATGLAGGFGDRLTPELDQGADATTFYPHGIVYNLTQAPEPAFVLIRSGRSELDVQLTFVGETPRSCDEAIDIALHKLATEFRSIPDVVAATGDTIRVVAVRIGRTVGIDADPALSAKAVDVTLTLQLV